jgi:hypothetical protein
MAETNDVVCPTCNAQAGKPCSKRFTDWPESIPHETRVEAAESRAAAPDTEPSPPIKRRDDHLVQPVSAQPQFQLPGLQPSLPESAPALPSMDGLFTQPARGRGSKALDDEHRGTRVRDLIRSRIRPESETSRRCLRYSCQICAQPEDYRAVGNVPQFAHLCLPCWLRCPDDEREHYERISADDGGPFGLRRARQEGDTKPDIPVMRQRTEHLGFSRLTIPPESTAMGQAIPQYSVCRPTHLHIVQRSGPPGAMLSMLRNGNYEHLMTPVPIELFRPISDELVRELSRTYTNADSLAAVLLNQGRVDMGTALIGNCLTIGVQNPDKHEECVIDAVMRVDTVVESRCL